MGDDNTMKQKVINEFGSHNCMMACENAIAMGWTVQGIVCNQETNTYTIILTK